MAAATEQVRIIIQRNRASRADEGVTKALRGTKWKRGWFLVAHDDRLMPYPTGGFNSTVTAANGGPLQVPGADANGGLRLIAKQDGVRYVQQGSGAGTAVTSITITDTGTTRQIYVSMNLSATAATVARALLAHAEAASLVDVAFTGTGGGIVADIGTATPESVPFVRPYGWADSEVNVEDQASDVTLDPLSQLGAVQYGIGRLLTDDTVKTPGPVFLTDNQTVTTNYAALKLPLRCDHLFDGDAYCEVL
jgi:hypothetical protein